MMNKVIVKLGLTTKFDFMNYAEHRQIMLRKLGNIFIVCKY